MTKPLTLVAVRAGVIDEVRAEIAGLGRRLDREAPQSSQPPSNDSIAATAKTNNARGQALRGPKRHQAVPGHRYTPPPAPPCAA